MAIIPIEDISIPHFWYREIAMFIILAEFLFNQYLNYRQIRRLGSNQKVPDELTELSVNEEEYSNSLVYSRAKLQFQVVMLLVSTILELALLYFFVEPFFWNLSGSILERREINKYSEFYRGIVFMGFQMIKDKFTSIPFNLYESFVLEEKFGFNKKTMWIFLYDECVSTIISIVLGIPIFYGFLWVVEAGGEYFYIYVEIFIIVIVFILMTIYPNWIAPLFNKYTELEDGTLKTKINNLAGKLNFPLTKIYVIDGSKRSNHSNAYFYGFGKNKRIVLFDTLIKQLGEDEIEAVLCHELGHWYFGHINKNLILSFLQIFVIFYIYGFFIHKKELFLSFGFHEMSIFIGTYLFMLLYSPISYISGLFILKLSRYFEFQADDFANGYGYGELLCKGLIKLVKENKSNLNPDPIYAAFKYSHPTLLERIKSINNNSKKKE